MKRRRDARFLTIAIAMFVGAALLGRMAEAEDTPAPPARGTVIVADVAGGRADPEWTLYSLGGGLLGLAIIYVRGLTEANRLNAAANQAVVENVFLREQVRDLKWDLNRAKGQAEAPAAAALVVADAASAAARVLDTARQASPLTPHD